MKICKNERTKRRGIVEEREIVEEEPRVLRRGGENGIRSGRREEVEVVYC